MSGSRHAGRGGRSAKRLKPEGEIRRSQMVGAYGPGALVDLREHAVLTGGLDFWNYRTDRARPVVHEPRLRDRLAERMSRLEPPLNLSSTAPFLEPPTPEDPDSQSRTCGVQALELPRWFVCQNPGCRALTGRRGLEAGRRHRCADGELRPTVPVRFVAVCRRGHLEDFPWQPFVHGRSDCPSPRYRLDEGVSGDLSDVSVSCTTCGAREKLSRARIQERRLPCAGRRPWLGDEGREECSEPLRLQVRTASNSYFYQVESALSIDDDSRAIEEAVDRVWNVLQAADAALLPAFRRIPEVGAALDGFDDDEVLVVIDAKRAGRGRPVEPLRAAELRRLRDAPLERPGEVPGTHDDFFARRVHVANLPSQISGVVLAHKLREVRVQVGFTRIEAATPDLDGEFDLDVQSQRLGLTTDWLPAHEVRGEGVLLELDEVRLHAWEQRAAVVARDRALHDSFTAWAQSLERTGRGPVYPGIRFYLLHSLSHLLLSSISLHCGYPSSSIRERLYCAPHDGDMPMAAVLLSTGTSGVEGTLGGLVDEGRRIDRHLDRALAEGSLCSNDPVCGMHAPSDASERYLEGAACHGCLYVSEPSCERFNLFLDRALVVPTLGCPTELAFFDR